MATLEYLVILSTNKSAQWFRTLNRLIVKQHTMEYQAINTIILCTSVKTLLLLYRENYGQFPLVFLTGQSETLHLMHRKATLTYTAWKSDQFNMIFSFS